MVAGQGNTTIQGMTGTGAEQVVTGQSNTVALLNNNADTILGGSGASSIYGGVGTGRNVYGFIAGHAAGTETIFNLKMTDTLVFGGYGNNPIAAEVVSQGSDHITLSDGTVITLQGIDYKLFS